MTDRLRCQWADADPVLQPYHDTEWGVPTRDDRALFELLVLEGAQAGLSWRTVLARRDAYRQAFCDFDPECVASFEAETIERLLSNPHIIRNRLKVLSARDNARAYLRVQQEWGSFAAYLWSWVDGQPIVHDWTREPTPPPSTPLAHSLSRDLKRRGFRFVGPTICYAYLQATGVVMDHESVCFRYSQLR